MIVDEDPQDRRHRAFLRFMLENVGGLLALAGILVAGGMIKEKVDSTSERVKMIQTHVDTVDQRVQQIAVDVEVIKATQERRR